MTVVTYIHGARRKIQTGPVHGRNSVLTQAPTMRWRTRDRHQQQVNPPAKVTP